ncbi:MAG: hypothetical protein ACI90V_013031, partial [Bacillariaceae sp.]
NTSLPFFPTLNVIHPWLWIHQTRMRVLKSYQHPQLRDGVVMGSFTCLQ